MDKKLKNIDSIYEEHQTIINQFEPRFRRFYIDEIDWDDRLSFILGPRGVGKTSIILQHIKETHGTDRKALYVSMDDLLVSDMRLYDIAQYHYSIGGTHLYVDEIHKYENWSLELKNIYDKLRKLKVAISGSSIMEIQKGNADLSRRSAVYKVPGLSFREYINIVTEHQLEAYSLTDIVENHVDIAHSIIDIVRPLEFYKDYLEHGFYPYFLEGKKSYLRKLNNVLNLILEVDMPSLLGVDISNVSKLKKLIYIITTQVPLTINSSKLSTSIGLNRNTLNSYLHYLDQASIFKLLWNDGRSYSILAKPDKLLLHNTNILHLTKREINIDTLRETFIASQLQHEHTITLPKSGDFLIDQHITIEIGGPNKDYTQIANLPNTYIAQDRLMIGSGAKIPLWLFGFLY